MRQNLLSSLKKELENSFGRKVISSRDCNQMVEDIYKKTGETVNANTLRRFFGLVKADYPPSSSTLTILSKYCGFNSIEEVEHISVKNDNPDTAVNKEEVLRYMTSLFKHTQVVANQERIFYPLVEQTIIFLERNPSLIDKFQREIAKTVTGQYYYYEKLVNMDRLNGYYGDGLRHYLRANDTEEGRIFAHSMQIFRFWLTKNKEQLKTHMSEIAAITATSDFPDHILGRFIAAKLYHAYNMGLPIDFILAEAKRYHAGIIARREDSPFTFPDYELIICEALLLTGHYDEGAEYIWHGKTYLVASGQEKNTLYNLWEDFANVKRGSKSKGKERNVDNEILQFTFSKKYNMIIALLSGEVSKSKPSAPNQRLIELIQETGYKKLLSLLV
ncbi:MAG: hypothetical protein JNN00_01450 [Chitinophagaceae bacterium]|nr:hypothetical protein [Chitinophagaceae bacterium]